MKAGEILAGKYRVDRVLGEGGMGVVVAATHLELEEIVAIKVLHPQAAQNADAVARFLREGRATARIKSEHIIRVRDVGRGEDGRPFLVMELLEGEDLGVVGARGPLPISDAIDYVLQACEALAEAHAVGIVHRDLKPSNLFLTRRRNGTPWIKILDFGISKIERDVDARRTSTKDVFGSPLYMSPEQLHSSADVDARTDVWAMGIVLYELLTGRPVFDETSLAMVHVAILQKPAPDVRQLRPDVPAAVAEAIRGALVKERDRRMPDVATFAAALAPYASPVGAEAYATLVAQRSAGPPTPRASAPSAAVLGGGGPGVTQGTFVTGSPAKRKGKSQLALVAVMAVVCGLAVVGVVVIALALRGRSHDALPVAAQSGAEPETAPSASGGETMPAASALATGEPAPAGGPMPAASTGETMPAASAGETMVTAPAASAAVVSRPAPRPVVPAPRPAPSSRILPDDRR